MMIAEAAWRVFTGVDDGAAREMRELLSPAHTAEEQQVRDECAAQDHPPNLFSPWLAGGEGRTVCRCGAAWWVGNLQPALPPLPDGWVERNPFTGRLVSEEAPVYPPEETEPPELALFEAPARSRRCVPVPPPAQRSRHIETRQTTGDRL